MVNCFNINRFTINIFSCFIAIFCTCIVFLLSSNVHIYLDVVPSNSVASSESVESIDDNNLKILPLAQEEILEWKIEIPKINVDAQIQEGTNDEVLNNFVGHFEETSLDQGNIGLAAHNRGYNVNYFERIKELETGDEIFYKYNRKYKKIYCKRTSNY